MMYEYPPRKKNLKEKTFIYFFFKSAEPVSLIDVEFKEFVCNWLTTLSIHSIPNSHAFRLTRSSPRANYVSVLKSSVWK